MLRYDVELKEYIIARLSENVSINDLYEEVVNKGYRGKRKTFGEFVRNLLKSPVGENYFSSFYRFSQFLHKQKITTIPEISEISGCTYQQTYQFIRLLRASGKEIIIEDDRIYLSENKINSSNLSSPLSEDKEIVLGICSDLHFGSTHCQITALNEFANICRREGVRHIICSGDVLAGVNVYKGQMFEVYAVSAEEQENSLMYNLPSGFDWYMIGGNHDRSFLKSNGYNPLRVITNYRKDIHYLGYDEAIVPILKNVDLKMWHPSGANTYAYSYRLQKAAEQTTIDEMKNIVQGSKTSPTIRFFVAGHLHIQMQCLIGSMLALHAGCFEGANGYLVSKGLVPAIGGWILKATLNNGQLKNFDCKFYLFEEIKEDFRNYRHDFNRNNGKILPLFG